MRRPTKKKKDAPRKKIARRPVRKPVQKIRKKVVKKAKFPLAGPAPKAEHAPQEPAWEDKRLPSHYNEDRLVLMVRDPWWLFAYWEVTPQRQKQVLAQIPQGEAERKTVLRVYDVTGSQTLPKANSYFDIELNFYADSWYIDVGIPDREWVTELGYRAGGRFFPLLRSNRVTTPAFGISDVLDEEWLLPEDIYYRLIGRSIGGENAGGSMDIRKLLERYLRNVVSSERLPESSKKVQNLAVQ